MKNFKEREDLIQFLRQMLNFEPHISIILSEEELDEVIEGIELELEPVEFSKKINNDEYLYAIEKYEDKQGEVHLFIQALELDDDCVITTHIENDVVIVLENLLEDDCFDKIDAADELIIVDYDDEEYEEIDNSNEDSSISEEVNEFIDQIIENIKNGECMKCNLIHLYQTGFLDGRNSLAFGLTNMLNDLVEED